ncbi:MAG: transglutaminase domain-containing protein [Lachnospiraceae bacterium]
MNRKLKKLQMLLVASVVILLAAMGTMAFFLITRIDGAITIEAGSTVTTEMFRHYEWDNAAFKFLELPEDLNKEGVYAAKIEASIFTYSVEIEVKDTTAPTATGVRVVSAYGNPVPPESFVTEIQDVSPCSVTYAAEPDVTRYGTQSVSLFVTDEAGNRTAVTAELYIPHVKTELRAELGGSVPPAEAFLTEEGGTISYVTDVAALDMNCLGETTVTLLADGIEVTSVLIVEDTTPPTAETKKVTTWLNKPKAAEEFIVSTKDKTEVTVSFVSEPDWSLEGEQNVSILLTDTSGNEAVCEAGLTIKRDTEKPTISVSNIDVVVGGTISYKKAVSYFDNIDAKEEMTLTIDRDSVDINKVGSYTVTYTVTDCSGNSVSAEGKVNVLAEEPAWADEEKIHAKADEILASILTDGMTDKQKAKAIYTWIKSHIGYISHSEKGDYMRGAYEGLFKRQGDCFVYAATAKELLTRAGIKNMDIVKSAVNPSHYWNLVDVGDGWQHFDSTPRKDKTEFFLMSDADLEAYSVAHKNSHIYDRSLYPEIQ